MNYFGTVSLFNGALALFTGLYVLFKNRHNLLFVSFAAFAISIAFWAIFYSILQIQETKSSALFYMRLVMLPCYYIPFAFLWFVSHLTETERVRRLFPFFWIVPLFFSLFAFSELNVKDVVARLYFPYWPEPGFLMHLFGDDRSRNPLERNARSIQPHIFHFLRSNRKRLLSLPQVVNYS